jgi:hypothetical protein
MRQVLLAVLGLLVCAVPAQAVSVAYIDGGEVWVASPDGTQKKKLAGVPDEEYTWREVVQADNGRVLAVRRIPGKISQINRFTLWAPDGTELYQSSLTIEHGWQSAAFPLSLDMDPEGKLVVYGYSNSNSGYPMGTYQSGTYVSFTDQPSAYDPWKIVGKKWPTLFGRQLVVQNGSAIELQRLSSASPITNDTEFDPWLDTSATGLELMRTDVAATGTVAAGELNKYAPSSSEVLEQKIGVFRFSSVGTPPLSGDCYLPAQGFPSDASLSQDGTLIAWKDDRGVVVAGVPDFSGSEPCTPTKPPVVIAAGGTSPSIGAAQAAVAEAPPAPPVTGPPPPTAPPAVTGTLSFKLPATLKASALTRGVMLSVNAPAGSVVKLVAKVGSKIVASGRGKANAKGVAKIRLKLNKAGRKLGRKLRAKTLVVKVSAGGKSKTVRRRLR